MKFVIAQSPPTPVALRLRVPRWSEGAKLAVNGVAVALQPEAHRYLELQRTWKRGDTVTLVLPMDAQPIAADPRVEETRNQVAVVRGPVVYCVESPDLPPGVEISSVFVPASATFEPLIGLPAAEGELAWRTVVLRSRGLQRPDPQGGPLYRPLSREPLQPIELTLIPYYAWANRGKSAMSVWLPVVLQP